MHKLYCSNEMRTSRFARRIESIYRHQQTSVLYLMTDQTNLLKAIRVIVREETQDIRLDVGDLKQDMREVKEDIKQLNKRVGILEEKVDDMPQQLIDLIATHFGEDNKIQGKRLDRLEGHLHLPPLTQGK